MIKVFLVFHSACKRFIDDRYLYQASALAFVTTLAIVPLSSIAMFIATDLPIFTQTILFLQQYIFTNFVPNSRVIIEEYLDLFSMQALTLPVSGMIFSFVTVFLLIALIKDVINRVWASPPYESYLSLFVHWLIILMMQCCVIIGIYLGYYILSLNWVNYTTSFLHLKSLLGNTLPIVINIIGFSVLYRVVPNTKPTWKSSFLGGITAAILFELAKKAFVFYIRFASNYELMYGILSVIPVFLIWIYLSWIIIIYGAIVTRTASV